MENISMGSSERIEGRVDSLAKVQGLIDSLQKPPADEKEWQDYESSAKEKIKSLCNIYGDENIDRLDWEIIKGKILNSFFAGLSATSPEYLAEVLSEKVIEEMILFAKDKKVKLVKDYDNQIEGNTIKPDPDDDFTDRMGDRFENFMAKPSRAGIKLERHIDSDLNASKNLIENLTKALELKNKND